MCDYEGREFGAFYLDSVCINGYLWDMDSGGANDDGGIYLDIGGDIPCPKCNLKGWVKYLSNEYLNDGYESVVHPLTTKMVKNVMAKIPSNHRRIAIRYWRQGRTEAIKEAKLLG